MNSQKLFLAILICLTALGLQAQDTLIVKGLISNNGGVAITVNIEVDYNTTSPQNSTVLTDTSGHYLDTFIVNHAQGGVRIWIVDCNRDTLTKHGGYYSANLIVILDLDYCANPAHSCTALFSKVQAYNNHNQIIPFMVHIIDQSSGNNLSYYWDFGDGHSSTIHSPTHTYSGHGPYLLCLTVSNVNCTDTFCDSVAIDTNGRLKSGGGFTIVVGGVIPGIANSELSQESIKIYPNPVLEYLIIEKKDELHLSEIKILTIDGKQVYSSTIIENSINVSNLEGGMYFIYFLNDKGEQYVQKFYKK